MNLSTRPLLTIKQFYTCLLLLVVIIDCYLVYINVLSHFRWRSGRLYIYDEEYQVLTIWSSLFSVTYALAVLVCMIGLYRRKYWAYILFHVLAIPAVFALGTFVYAGYVNGEPISGVYWLAIFMTIGLLGLIVGKKKRLFRASRRYSWNEVFLIIGGLGAFAGLFYIFLIKL